MGSFTSFLVCQFLFFNAGGADVFHRLRLFFPPINVLAVSQSTSPASKPAETIFGEVFLQIKAQGGKWSNKRGAYYVRVA